MDCSLFPRNVLDGAALAPEGFKILLEILVRAHWEEVVEVPYGFAARESGLSKAGWTEGVHFLRQLIRLRLWSIRHRLGHRTDGSVTLWGEAGTGLARQRPSV